MFGCNHRNRKAREIGSELPYFSLNDCLIQLFCSWRFDRNLFAMRTPELSLALNVHEIIVNGMQIYTVLNIEANRNLSFLFT